MQNMALRETTLLLNVPAVATSDVTSDSADVSGYEGADFVVIYGSPDDTLSGSIKMEAKLQESDDDSTFSDVAGTELYGSTSNSFALADANSDASKRYSLGYDGDERYVRVVVTFTGTHTNGTIVTILAVRGMPRSQTSDRTVNP